MYEFVSQEPAILRGPKRVCFIIVGRLNTFSPRNVSIMYVTPVIVGGRAGGIFSQSRACAIKSHDVDLPFDAVINARLDI